MRLSAIGAIAILLCCSDVDSNDVSRGRPNAGIRSPRLRVVVTPTDPARRTDDQYIWLVAENPPARCQPMYLDSVFTPPAAATRKLTYIQMQLIGAHN